MNQSYFRTKNEKYLVDNKNYVHQKLSFGEKIKYGIEHMFPHIIYVALICCAISYTVTTIFTLRRKAVEITLSEVNPLNNEGKKKTPEQINQEKKEEFHKVQKCRTIPYSLLMAVNFILVILSSYLIVNWCHTYQSSFIDLFVCFIFAFILINIISVILCFVIASLKKLAIKNNSRCIYSAYKVIYEIN